MLDTIRDNKWKLFAILFAIIAVIFYLYPKKECIDIPTEEDEDKILEFSNNENKEVVE